MRRVVTAGAIAFVSVALPARAEDGALHLTWTAPVGCPSTEAVRAATLRDAYARGAKSGMLEADAHVEQKPNASWRVRLHTRRGSTTGEREIEATTCNGVADATAVVLALALVPPGPEPEPTAEPAAPTAPAPAPASKREVSDVPDRSGGGTHALALGASLAGDASTLPALTIGGSLTLGWTPGRFRIEVDVRRWASQSRAVSASYAGARFSMTSLGGRGCWAVARTRAFDVSPCTGADVQLISAQGYGADSNVEATGRWATVTGGALGRVSLTSWFALRGRFEALVPLSRPTFVVENEGSVHRPPTLGIAASLGAEVLFL